MEVITNMNGVIDKIIEYLQYPFVIYAIIVGTLIALCASLLGVILVLKRFSNIGTGLSNVAFGAMVISGILNLTYDIPVVIAITTISAVFLLKSGKNTKIKGDASVAMISVGTLGIGYLMMNIFPSSSNISADVCTTLFGSTSILTLSIQDVWISIVLSLVVVGIFIVFYNKIFAVTFDEDFSVAVGTNANGYNLLIAIVTGVIIVLAMQLVGSLLITALVIFPAVSAMRIFKDFKRVVICAAVFAVISALVGILISIVGGTPVGSTIVAVHILGFLAFNTIGTIKR